MFNKIKKIVWILCLAVIASTLLSPSAFATGVTIRALKAVSGGTTAVYNSTGVGQTYLPAGYLVQVIQMGGSAIDPPDSSKTNYVGGDDVYITSFVVGVGTGNVAGSFYSQQGTISGKTIYLRAWEATTYSTTTKYGNSQTQAVPGAGSSPIVWNVPDFATTSSVPTTTPTITLSPTFLSYSATYGGSNPASKTFTVTISGATSLSWTASKTQSWLTLTGGSGTTNGTVTAAVNISGLSAGSYSDTITVSGTGATSKTISVSLTVSGTTVPDYVTIDKFEGTLGSEKPTSPSSSVNYYYIFAPTSAGSPEINRVYNSGCEGSYALGIGYPALTDSNNAWRGFGASLKSTLDLSPYTYITYLIKGDGTSQKYKIQLKDSDGSVYGSSEIDLNTATWVQRSIKISDISTQVTAGTTSGLDTKNITDYQFIFTGLSATAASKDSIFVDNVVATKDAGSVTTDPAITNISPSKAKGGETVTITGSNFSTAGKIEFKNMASGLLAYLGSKDTGTLITSWSDTAIAFKVPTAFSGKMDISIIRDTDSKQSNPASFEVSAQSTGRSYNTPNPFNPKGGESTTIYFDPGSETTLTVYLFDITAQMVEKISWNSATTTQGNSVTWTGKNSYGEISGDGVYLYRIAAGSKLIGRGKILVINK